MEIDKKQILNRFKQAKKITSDIELARFLGISRGTLSNWKARNSLDFDLLFSKCEHESIHWLVTGEGEVFYSNREAAEVPTITEPTASTDALQMIADLARENGQLQAENIELKKELARLGSARIVSAEAAAG